MDSKIHVLFVCTGNICRSPMAEAVFQQLVRDQGLEQRFIIESAGTSAYHIGERPHIGTQNVLRKNKVRLADSKRAIRVDQRLLDSSDYVIAMDTGHEVSLKGRTNAYRLLEFASNTGEKNVPDPYYDDKFDEVFDLVKAGCVGLLDFIRERENL
jgi:protein-tyrosine phosphatase